MTDLNNLAPDVLQQRPAPDVLKAGGLWKSFIAAVQFLTRLPIPEVSSESPKALHRAPVFFPLVGALIGIFTAACVGVSCLVWPIWLGVLVALAVELRLTGALHEDAVADFCDAFGGGWTREEVLLILKDSRIGSYGTLGLFVAMSLRAAATIAIVTQHGLQNPLLWGSAIVASSMIARWVMVLAMVCVPPVPGRDSLAIEIGQRLTGPDLVIAGFMGTPFAVLFAYSQPWHCFAAILLVAPTVWWFLFRMNRKLGGMTGDCLGCLGYVSQVLVLLAAAMRSEHWSNLL